MGLPFSLSNFVKLSGISVGSGNIHAYKGGPETTQHCSRLYLHGPVSVVLLALEYWKFGKIDVQGGHSEEGEGEVWQGFVL